MPKFYVESGPMTDVVAATDALSACLKTVRRAIVRHKKWGKRIQSASIFTVNEKGFLRDKEVTTTADFVQYDAREILKELKG